MTVMPAAVIPSGARRAKSRDLHSTNPIRSIGMAPAMGPRGHETIV
jgi:hypothetical protein